MCPTSQLVMSIPFTLLWIFCGLKLVCRRWWVHREITILVGHSVLRPVGSASVGESPPLEHWLQDDLQKTSVERISPLSYCLLAGPQVIGEELVKILLCDFYQRDECLPIQSLKGARSSHWEFSLLPDCG